MENYLLARSSICWLNNKEGKENSKGGQGQTTSSHMTNVQLSYCYRCFVTTFFLCSIELTVLIADPRCQTGNKSGEPDRISCKCRPQVYMISFDFSLFVSLSFCLESRIGSLANVGHMFSFRICTNSFVFLSFVFCLFVLLSKAELHVVSQCRGFLCVIC